MDCLARTNDACGTEPKEAPIETVKVRWDLPAGKRSDFTSYDRAVADAAWASRGLGESRKLLIVPMPDVGQGRN